MKKSKVFFVSSLLFICFCFSANAQIKVSTSGSVTIGSTLATTKALEVHGICGFRSNASSGFYFQNIYSSPIILPQWNNALRLGNSGFQLWSVNTNTIYVNNVYSGSDIKLKENIRPLSNSLDRIKMLNPVIYDFKEEIYNDSLNAEREDNISNRRDHVGFIANEVQNVYPKLVKYREDADHLDMNYIGLIPELVKGMQEQQILIERLQTEINVLKSRDLKSLSLSGIEDFDIVKGCILHQNAPNPFGETTSIRYNIPEGTTNADIIIYDMTGKQISRIPLTESGESSVNIPGGEMDPGIYLYSMIVNGLLINTKQMILTDLY